MEEYWEGGVSAIVRRSQLTNTSNNVETCPDDTSTNRGKKGRFHREPFQHKTTKCSKSTFSSSSYNKLNDANGFSKNGIKNSVCDDKSMMRSMVLANDSLKKRKTAVDEAQAIESGTANKCSVNRSSSHTWSDNAKQLSDVRINGNKFKVAESTKFTSLDLNSAGKKINDNLQCMKPINTKSMICDNFDKNGLTVFVGNLPLTYDHKKVVKLFSKFGEVESARIRCVPVANAGIKKKTSAITKQFHPNRNSAVAYVVFKSKDSVFKATAQNGMLLHGHHLRIDSAVSQKRDSKKSVFVGSLPFDIKEDELWNLFKDCGEIEDVRIVRDKNISMGKGFGYVNFKSSTSVELALKLNGSEIKNRKINVERCIHKREKSDSAGSFCYQSQRKRKNGNLQAMVHSRKPESNCIPNDFQGRKAEKKSRKKKLGLTKDAVRRNRIKSVFLSTKTSKYENAKTGIKS